MSHFVVLVVGNHIEDQLAPYQENNMCDCPEEYLTFVDEEEDFMREYLKEGAEMLKTPGGNIVDKYDQRFKVTVSEGHVLLGNTKYVVPSDHEIIEMPFKELYPTFEDFMEKYHKQERDPKKGRYGYWTNDNAKWDWYKIGGRWTGFFKLKPVKLLEGDQPVFDDNGFSLNEIKTLISFFKKDREKFEELISKYGKDKQTSVLETMLRYQEEIYPEHSVGEPGIMTPAADFGYADQARKKDIDFEGMKKEAAEKAAEEYDLAMEAMGDSIKNFIPWKKVVYEMFKDDLANARAFYNNQEASNKLWKNRSEKLGIDVEKYLCSREDFIKNRRESATVPFAIVKDSIWYEKGEMGWWGMVANEKDQSEWNKEVNKLLNDLPEDTLLTAIDCHI